MQNTTAEAGSSQPWSGSFVAKRTGAFTTTHSIISAGDASLCILGFESVADLAVMFAGTGVTATATDSVTHAIQFVGNSAASVINVDGTPSTVDPGTRAWTFEVTNSGWLYIGNTRVAGQPFTGILHEAGVWPGGFSGAQQTAMNANQHAYWGF
jgi:hypothetical protein